MTGIVERKDDQIRYLAGAVVLLVIAVLLLAWFAVVAEQQLRAPEPVVSQEIQPAGFIYIDESAKTGFMTSERYDIRFEGFDYPVAGSDDLETVYHIDVFKYPLLDPVTFRVDSFEEAVEFLEGLQGEWNDNNN